METGDSRDKESLASKGNANDNVDNTDVDNPHTAAEKAIGTILKMKIMVKHRVIMKLLKK